MTAMFGDDGWRMLAGRFDRLAQIRGQGYFSRGLVAPVSTEPGAIAAAVTTPTGVEQARILQLGSQVHYSCSCAPFQKSLGACEHLWAVVLFADAEALLRPALKSSNELQAQRRLTWPALGDEDDSGEDEDNDDYEFLQSYEEAAATARSVGVSWQALQHSVAQRSRVIAPVEAHYFLAEEPGYEGWFVAVGKQKQGRVLGPLAPVTPSSLAKSLAGDELELTSMLESLRAHDFYRRSSTKAHFKTATLELLLPRLVSSGRCRLLPRRTTGVLAQLWHLFGAGTSPNTLAPKLKEAGYAELLTLPVLTADAGAPWELELQLSERARSTANEALVLEARPALVRGADRRPLDQVRLTQRGGELMFADASVGACSAADAHWLASLLQIAPSESLLVPKTQLTDFLNLAFGPTGVSRVDLPSSFERVTGIELQPVLHLGAPRGRNVSGQVFFEYAETRVSVRQHSGLVLLSSERVLERDRAGERGALGALRQAGFDGEALGGRASGGDSDVKIAGAAVLPAVRAAIEAGFQVFAEGKRYRALSSFDIQVESGLDWFEVRGGAKFGDAPVPLPALLRQARAGNGLVELGDGSFGMLPDKWLKRWGGLAELAPKRNGVLRFSTRQLGIAEALVGALTGEPDEAELPGLAPLRARIDHFYRVTPLEPPASFMGSLRHYQAHGLSWLGALSDMRLGACLADDMGLGKTIQVLAHFARLYAPTPTPTPTTRSRKRSRSPARRPSLIVMPRSLLANWADEAARFAPELRVHTHWGPDRGEVSAAFERADVVFTTYGTLRLDIEELAKLELGTVVLDEAQAIKNASSATAKCARLLQAEHRIALSGTPIENHLGELWSLFEFLNPGMLAELPALGKVLNSGQASPAALQLIQRVLRPFVLRRTKQEVATDLPERSEQTLFVDLEPEERKHYDQLLRFYKSSIAKQGPSAAASGTPHVLEALLRLRQAACHPGLIDRARSNERSSKVELLLERLRGLAGEGHQALVFSQFTSLLAILRTRLEEEHISFEYLDGKTRDRAAAVARFQADPTLSVFLISLKAGGVGLNLTAADYVFILDPWWNPAVEAQAVDRAHRIGQTRPVIAYRLLARNTVEERVAQLQDKKRGLIAAVMGEEGAFAGKLTRGDLESLLGLGDA